MTNEGRPTEPAAPNTLGSDAEAKILVASQWTLMWRKFRKHRLAMIGTIVIIFLYILVFFCGFLSPYLTTTRFRRYLYAPPQKLHWVHPEEGFRLRPDDGRRFSLVLTNRGTGAAGMERAEMFKQYWEEVGIETVANGIEVQINDTHGKENPGAHDCGGVIGTAGPSKNVAKPAGEWQTFDIVFRAARFEGDRKTENARITVYQNGTLIHDDFEIPRKTGAGKKEGPDPGPIKLQGHHNPVKFRNVWIQELSLD